MVTQRRWMKVAGMITFAAVVAAAGSADAGWHHRRHGSSGGSYGSGGSSGGSYSSYGGASSGGSYGSYGSSGSHGSWGGHHHHRRAHRAYYSSYGSSGGSSGGSYGGSSGGSSGGSYGGSSGGSSGGSYGGSAGGYASAGYSTGYSAAMPVESYRIISDTPSATGGEVGNPRPATPAPAAKDSTGAAAPVKTSLTLHVPADAKVWLAGNPTASAGETRHFETATLAAGRAWRNYEIRVTAVIDGEERTLSKVIDLTAGDSLELSLDPVTRTASVENVAAR